MIGKTYKVAMTSHYKGVGKTMMTVAIANYLHYMHDIRTLVLDCDKDGGYPLATQRERDLLLYATDEEFRAKVGRDTFLSGYEFYPVVKSSPLSVWNDVSVYLQSLPLEKRGFRMVLVDYPALPSFTSELLQSLSRFDCVLTPWIPHADTVCKTVGAYGLISRFLESSLYRVLAFWNNTFMGNKEHKALVYFFDNEYTKKFNHQVLDTIIGARPEYSRPVQDGGAFSTIFFNHEKSCIPGFDEDVKALLHELNCFITFMDDDLFGKAILEERKKQEGGICMHE